MHVSNSMQHTYQEGLETWQELHSVQLQCLIELVALRYSACKWGETSEHGIQFDTVF